MEVSHGVAHLLVGFDLRRQALREAFWFDDERLGETLFEDRDVDPAALELDQRVARGGVVPEGVPDGVLGQALAGAEGVERAHHARRQDAAPVDQQRV